MNDGARRLQPSGAVGRRNTDSAAGAVSTVRNADRILVLDAGRISAEGRHRQLLETSPLYQQLCSQLGDDDVDSQPARSSTRQTRRV
jgi:ATP-binding cassette subfamily B protein